MKISFKKILSHALTLSLILFCTKNNADSKIPILKFINKSYSENQWEKGPQHALDFIQKCFDIMTKITGKSICKDSWAKNCEIKVLQSKIDLPNYYKGIAVLRDENDKIKEISILYHRAITHNDIEDLLPLCPFIFLGYLDKIENIKKENFEIGDLEIKTMYKMDLHKQIINVPIYLSIREQMPYYFLGICNGIAKIKKQGFQVKKLKLFDDPSTIEYVHSGYFLLGIAYFMSVLPKSNFLGKSICFFTLLASTIGLGDSIHEIRKIQKKLKKNLLLKNILDNWTVKTYEEAVQWYKKNNKKLAQVEVAF